jgi:hypothetical protein
MSTDAGSAAAPEDAATRDVASERPGLESGDPQSADSATSTPETADRGVDGSAPGAAEDAADRGTGAGPATETSVDAQGPGAPADRSHGGGGDAQPAAEGFVTSMLRDATITGLPGETGAPPAEPHAPQAQQQGDEPVGSEPRVGDNPDGVD